MTKRRGESEEEAHFELPGRNATAVLGRRRRRAGAPLVLEVAGRDRRGDGEQSAGLDWSFGDGENSLAKYETVARRRL